MPLLMLVMIVGMLLGALVVPMIISTDRSTRYDTTRVHALDAAQAGIDAMLAQIRAATDGSGIGDASQLPCNPLSGSVSTNGSGTYTVSVKYYMADPVTTSNPTPIICAQGYGTYDAVSGLRAPRFALLTSTGADGATQAGTSANRTLYSTYKFRTSDTNIPGGQIRIYPNSTATDAYCMDAGSPTPAIGAVLNVQVCSTSTPPASQQMFAYRSDLTIQLLSSITSANPNGLCLGTANATAGDSMALLQCSALGSPNYKQIWSSDDQAHLQGSKSDKSNTSGLCINLPAQSGGQVVTLQTCAGGVTDPNQTWVASPSAGAGQAGAANSQLDSFSQFGRCVDATNNSVGPGTAALPGGGTFIILYSCKQNPNPSQIGANQRWTSSPALTPLPTIGQWLSAYDTTYCLTSPRTVGGYVTTQKCSTTPSNQTTWTTYQTKDASGKDLSYNDLYTMKDSAGLCLGVGPNSDVYNGQYYKAIVTTCDGSTSQKWNAAATVRPSQLQNTREK
jgi:type II secretory pathway pseudopilin PulG